MSLPVGVCGGVMEAVLQQSSNDEQPIIRDPAPYFLLRGYLIKRIQKKTSAVTDPTFRGESRPSPGSQRTKYQKNGTSDGERCWG